MDYLRPKDDSGIPGEFVWHPIRITTYEYDPNGFTLMIFDEDHPLHMALWEETYEQETDNE
jgi:hypothetical protein